MTSRSSTFPYDVEQCEKFLKLLSMSDESATSPYVTCIIGKSIFLYRRRRLSWMRSTYMVLDWYA